MFGPFMMVLWLLVLGAAVYFVMRAIKRQSPNGRSLEILKERFARGEMTQARMRSSGAC